MLEQRKNKRCRVTFVIMLENTDLGVGVVLTFLLLGKYLSSFLLHSDKWSTWSALWFE